MQIILKVKKMKVQANKQMLLSLKKNLQFLSKSLELLDYKRELIINEIRKISVHADQEREQVNTNLKEAFDFLLTAYMDKGKNTINRISQTALPHFNIKMREFSYMGVVLPEIEYKEDVIERPIEYGILDTSINLDRAVVEFQNTINLIIKLASTETSIFRLVNELNKVQRRINALEKIFIPEYKETIKKIGFILEEKERSNISIIKILKERFSKEV